MTGLLPCPFCGGEAEIRGNSALFVQCVNCGTRYGDRYHTTKAEAIAAWNTRVERTCHADYRGGGYGIGGWYCSECGGYMHDDIQQDMAYCPNCGARVIGGERHSWRELENSDQYIAAAHAFDTTNHNTCCERGE